MEGGGSRILQNFVTHCCRGWVVFAELGALGLGLRGVSGWREGWWLKGFFVGLLVGLVGFLVSLRRVGVDGGLVGLIGG